MKAQSRLTDEAVRLWDAFAMEYFKVKLTGPIIPYAPLLAAEAYEYASAMMREREARALAMTGMEDDENG